MKITVTIGPVSITAEREELERPIFLGAEENIHETEEDKLKQAIEIIAEKAINTYSRTSAWKENKS